MLLNLTTLIIALIAIYFLCDMVALIKEKQFSLARSRTYAIILGLLMTGRMIYGYFADDFTQDDGIPNRGIFVVCTIGAATLYSLVDLIVALVKKRGDCKFIRRKLTFFLFMFVLLIFYMWMKKAL